MMSDAIIQMTDAAVAHIHRTIEKRGSGIGFRLSVKRTGCSGYMYVPEIIDAVKTDDVLIQCSQGLMLYLDPACVPIIQGTVIDYVKKNLGVEQLEFENPNADSLCGCGESFNLKSEQEDVGD